MTRSASFLAALASAALPGLDPVSVQAVRGRPGDHFDLAFVEDSQERSWVVQAPRTAVAGAMLEDITELSMPLGRRLDLATPMIRGQAVVPEGRAVVYPRLPGRPLDFAGLPEGLGLAADVGRALAHIHNLEVELFEDAGRPSYDAEATRSRLLSDVDRAAATGHVPTALLSRWEHTLEDVSLWRFLPTPVHGNLVGSNVLASFDDEGDAGTGRVRAVLGWEESHVGDPAEDFADLAASASRHALESVLEAYGPSRIDRPDPHLLVRARLAAELRLVRRLLRALAADERALVEQAAEDLRTLEDRAFSAGPEESARATTRPARRRVLLSEADPSTAAADPAPATDQSAGRSSTPDGSPRPIASSETDGPNEWGPSAEPDRSGQPSPPSPDGAAEVPSAPKSRIAPAHVDTVAVPTAPDQTDARTRPPAGTVPSAGPGWQGDSGQRADAGTQARSDPAAGADRGSVEHVDAAPQPGPGRPGQAERHGDPPPVLSSVHFEIEDAEPLPAPAPTADGARDEEDEEDDGVLDLHEGASEFVPVEPRPRRAAPPDPA